MHPILLELPNPFSGQPFLLRSFGVMVALGFLVGSHLLQRLALRWDPELPRGAAQRTADAERLLSRYASVVLWVLVGVILGARAMYVLVEMARGTWKPQSPFEVFAIWQGGLAMYGGFAGAVVLGLWRARKVGLRALPAFDIGVVAGFVGLAIGRVGCLLVGDDHGLIVPEAFASLPFPITLHVPNPMPEHSLFGPENAGQVLWATQVWMALNALVLAWLGWRRLRARRYAGQIALELVFLYALTRGAIEAFRGDLVRGVWFGGHVSTSQLIALATGAVALTLLVRNRARREPEIEALAQPALGGGAG